MQTVKEKFIRDLIDELNDVNYRAVEYEGQSPKVDVPYVVSVIDQQLDKCTEFLEDISKNTYCINGFDEDTTGGYTNGRIRILIEHPQRYLENMCDSYKNYVYSIEFLYDNISLGYCQCTPDMEYYNEEHDCCGCGCDWDAPAFRLTKETVLMYGIWDGYERDYWDYKRRFLAIEQNNKAELNKIIKEQEKKRLEDEIRKLQDKLNKLAS